MSAEDLIGIMITSANMIFDQNWEGSEEDIEERCNDAPERKKICTQRQDVKANENKAIFPKVKIREF